MEDQLPKTLKRLAPDDRQQSHKSNLLSLLASVKLANTPEGKNTLSPLRLKEDDYKLLREKVTSSEINITSNERPKIKKIVSQKDTFRFSKRTKSLLSKLKVLATEKEKEEECYNKCKHSQIKNIEEWSNSVRGKELPADIEALMKVKQALLLLSIYSR